MNSASVRPGNSHDTELGRLLFRDLAESLDRALGSDGGAREQLDRLLETAAREARSGDLGRAAFEGIGEPEANRLERAFTAARTVAEWGGITCPEPEAFWDAGVDRIAVSRALMADATLVPVPTPHGLGAERWTELFRAAARTPTSPLSLASPLALAPDVLVAFGELDVVPRSTPVVTENFRGAEDALRWTLRLIPASPVPARTNLSHTFGPHPTMPEMLMLQLILLTMGDDVVDRQSFTWLHGTFAGGRFAARHFFDAAQRCVGVNTRETGNQGPHLGVRSPIG